MIKIIKKYWIKTLVAFGIASVLTLIYLFTNMKFNSFKTPVYYVNAFSIGGFATICIGGLSWVNYAGAFEFITYSFTNKRENGHKIDYSSYIDEQAEKRKEKKGIFLPYILVGLFFVIISFIPYLFIEM